MLEFEHDICTKWPAARLTGPSVAPELALEYIRRTDPGMCGHGFTNDRLFRRQLHILTGHHDGVSADPYPLRQWVWDEAYENAFGHVRLEHLSSHWVATSNIGGPYGPVHPDGTVRLACNFGKWPSVEEVEADLAAVATNFPWLQFHLSVWGAEEESDDGPPSHNWLVGSGQWQRVSQAPALMPQAEPFNAVIQRFMGRVRGQWASGETTWSVDQLQGMWGMQVATARAAADAAMQLQLAEDAQEQQLLLENKEQAGD